MNEIQTFDFDGSGIRTLTIDEEPYFVGKDVAQVLGYRDTADALKKHVDEEDKLTRQFADSNPDGSVRITKTTKVTGKGQVWLTNEFMGDRA